MTKQFCDLVADIHQLLGGGYSREEFTMDSKTAKDIVSMSKRVLVHTLDMLDHSPKPPRLITDPIRMSEIGTPCMKKLHYKWYNPEKGHPPYAEPPHPTLPIKFTFGDYMEELVLFLASMAGHEVRDHQKEVSIVTRNGNKAVGHIDATVDGVVVDVKSAADVSFHKYKREGLTEQNDTFGYRWQIDAYATALGTTKRAFIFINKHDGEILIIDRSDEPLLDVVPRIDAIAAGPHNALDDVEDPKGLGTKLGVVCSYCEFKHDCKHPEGYIISGRPTYFRTLTPKGEAYVADKAKIAKPEAFDPPF